MPCFCRPLLHSLRGVVDKVLHCHCGFEARAEDEERLVAAVRRHAFEAHGMALSHDEALVLAFRVALDEEAPTAISPDATTPMKEDT